MLWRPNKFNFFWDTLYISHAQQSVNSHIPWIDICNGLHANPHPLSVLPPQIFGGSAWQTLLFQAWLLPNNPRHHEWPLVQMGKPMRCKSFVMVDAKKSQLCKYLFFYVFKNLFPCWTVKFPLSFQCAGYIPGMKIQTMYSYNYISLINITHKISFPSPCRSWWWTELARLTTS